MATVSVGQLRTEFFEFLFGTQKGYLCIAYAPPASDPKLMREKFRQTFFDWPTQRKSLEVFLDENAPRKHLWFSVHLFSRAERRTEYAVGQSLVYADLDASNPESV